MPDTVNEKTVAGLMRVEPDRSRPVADPNTIKEDKFLLSIYNKGVQEYRKVLRLRDAHIFTNTINKFG